MCKQPSTLTLKLTPRVACSHDHGEAMPGVETNDQENQKYHLIFPRLDNPHVYTSEQRKGEIELCGG
jgi:hypothetical protein